jgi:regulatory protein
MLITEIVEQKRNKGRLSVFLDGEFGFGITKEDAILYNISEGRSLTEAELSELTKNVVESDAMRYAVKYLSYSARTTKEVVQKLKEYEFSQEIIKKTVVYLRKRKYLDDLAYAKNYAKSRLSRAYGVYRVRFELKHKGIKTEYIDEALDIEDYDPQSVITELLKKRIKSVTKKGFYENERRKIFNYLKNRGFAYEDVKQAIDGYWEKEMED